MPGENIWVSMVAMGEGWHNYHHVFPWDYRAAELGSYSLNICTFWLDQFAKIGWAYDLKRPSDKMIRAHAHKFAGEGHPVEVDEKEASTMDLDEDVDEDSLDNMKNLEPKNLILNSMKNNVEPNSILENGTGGLGNGIGGLSNGTGGLGNYIRGLGNGIGGKHLEPIKDKAA